MAPEGRKVGSLKRRVRTQLATGAMKNCTPLWREARFQVKMYKTPQLRTTFGSCDVEKVHAVVARSTFPSQNVQNTSVSDHFLKFRCRKSARRCGEKHISKSKVLKSDGLGPLLEVQMSKKCTTVVARSTFPSQNGKNTRVSDHFWRFRCRFASLHYTTLHYTTLHSTTLHYTTFHNTTTTTTQLHNYIALHSTTLHYTKLHYSTLHYTPLHYITLHSTTLQHTKLHYTTLHYTTLQLHNYTPLHSSTAHYTTLRYATLHYTTLHYTTFHYTSLHYTTLHSTR